MSGLGLTSRFMLVLAISTVVEKAGEVGMAAPKAATVPMKARITVSMIV